MTEVPNTIEVNLADGFDWLNHDYDFEKLEDIVTFTMCVKQQYEKVLRVNSTINKISPTEAAKSVCLRASEAKAKVFQSILKQDPYEFMEASKVWLPIHHEVMEVIDDNETLDSGSYLTLCDGTKYSKDSFEKLVPKLYNGRYFNKSFSQPSTGEKMTPFQFCLKYAKMEPVEK